jgi:hypothetical protein
MSYRDEPVTKISHEEILKGISETYTGSPLHLGLMNELLRRQTEALTEAISKYTTSSDKSSQWIIGLTAALIVLTGVLVWQTSALIKDAKVQTENQSNISLNSLFFNAINTQIINAIESGGLILVENGGHFTDAQLDNYLGEFDTIESAYKKGLLSEFDLCDSFSYYLQITNRNSEIQRYIAEEQKQDPGFFVSFQDLVKIAANSKNENCRN